jgi:hypothetical protein
MEAHNLVRKSILGQDLINTLTGKVSSSTNLSCSARNRESPCQQLKTVLVVACGNQNVSTLQINQGNQFTSNPHFAV